MKSTFEQIIFKAGLKLKLIIFIFETIKLEVHNSLLIKLKRLSFALYKIMVLKILGICYAP